MDTKAYLIEHLPERFQESVRRFSRQKEWMEIRMRTGAPLAASATDGNYLIGKYGILRKGDAYHSCGARDLSQTVSALCEGSGYRYFDTLSGGFLTLDCGIRLGIACERQSEIDRVPEQLSSLNIRLPGMIEDAADPFLREMNGRELSSALVLSPPGGGKTTFLRALAKKLSRGAFGRPGLRVAVVDERRELFPAVLTRDNCDVLSGFSKGEGIRRAVRLFSPQVLICDEIGGEEDIAAIKEAGGSGVILFASCHASSAKEALSKPGIRALTEAGVFPCFLILTPVPGPRFSVEIHLEAAG